MNQTIEAVIGRGFGDEGKGMAVDWLCSRYPECVVVKHNGGGQAGHTVEICGEQDKRFVFHQLSSGSFRHAITFWADSFYPDLYKLSEELDDFKRVAGFLPEILCDLHTNTVLIDDVLLNMLLEDSRGENRHGSCGMGINEADLRTGAGYGITIAEISNMTHRELFERLQQLRQEYYGDKIKEYGLAQSPSEYLELLQAKEVLWNAAEVMLKNVQVVKAVDMTQFLRESPHIVFETGQGLLLDANQEQFYPHVTASRTGLFHPNRILQKAGLSLSEAVYVARSYVTRHGAGPFPGECDREKLGEIIVDRTNQPNPWQGTLRYGEYLSKVDMMEPIVKDIQYIGMSSLTNEIPLEEEKGRLAFQPKISLLVTHLNETNQFIMTQQGKLTLEELYSFCKVQFTQFGIYSSQGFYAEDIEEYRG